VLAHEGEGAALTHVVVLWAFGSDSVAGEVQSSL
jgi:hypothetical protein